MIYGNNETRCNSRPISTNEISFRRRKFNPVLCFFQFWKKLYLLGKRIVSNNDTTSRMVYLKIQSFLKRFEKARSWIEPSSLNWDVVGRNWSWITPVIVVGLNVVFDIYRWRKVSYSGASRDHTTKWKKLVPPLPIFMYTLERCMFFVSMN